VRPPTQGRRGFPPWSRLAALIFAGAALVSAVQGARVVVPELDAWRATYSELEPERRELDPLVSLGFEAETWERLRQALRPGDRYLVRADVPYQHEIRNYAGYALLPSVLVADPEQADAIVYWQVDPPASRPCMDVGQDVCVARREP
jgi:hypothetical protein